MDSLPENISNIIINMLIPFRRGHFISDTETEYIGEYSDAYIFMGKIHWKITQEQKMFNFESNDFTFWDYSNTLYGIDRYKFSNPRYAMIFSRIKQFNEDLKESNGLMGYIINNWKLQESIYNDCEYEFNTESDKIYV